MFQIEDLWVSIEGKEVLKGINLKVEPGETHALFGKNGSGKTTLLMTIMGFSHYKVGQGRILFQGQDITALPTYERAKLGIGMAFQRPPTIRGVKTKDIFRVCAGGRISVEALAFEYGFESFMDREINYGFSGGEIKKSELLQLVAQDPKLVLLDEPESGVDLENLQLIGQIIRRLLEKDLRRVDRTKSGLIITHTGHILTYLNADVGHVMADGQVACQGHPMDILDHVKKSGYEECVRCLCPQF
ncbi:ABC transporter ATP-binding protein [Desulfobacca acetoxidans]|uniref:ABC transporter related protein n=1 Tax=Desulfobacca acetoxidans (strain ATCC 700848 / DSM 11109 / ASRB2) TaxID=880072 RepID=F2NH98_DESAR|nr:ABC transporter ATP-binding protein [Desulfobacca acetoxidans]AEB08940.1 ABC transporter related protein [Desulfobacca acetoxidans DSM 11109]HAY22728.1 ABC transporter ATP-binding protein [Desulfobacterales bacterium]